MLINRIFSGLVFRDTFDSATLDSKWRVSPSDPSRYSLQESPGYLRMKHGEPSLYILMNNPRFDYVFEVDTSYTPTATSDQGGISVFQSVDSRLDLLEYYDVTKGSTVGNENLRVIRSGDQYEAYGKNSSATAWTLIGASILSANKIGMALHGINEAGSIPLDIAEVRMYRSVNVQIGNLVKGQTVKLLDSANNVLGSGTCQENSDHVNIDCTNMKFPIAAKIQLFDTVGVLLEETSIYNDIWGGDIFWFGIKLDLEVDAINLRQDREFFLGSMQNGIIERQMYVANNSDIPMKNISIQVVGLNAYHGYEWVDIAMDVYGQPGTYQDKLDLGTIEPGQKVGIWCKIIRQPAQQFGSLQDYKFTLMIEGG